MNIFIENIFNHFCVLVGDGERDCDLDGEGDREKDGTLDGDGEREGDGVRDLELF